jgi:hypothetical protein
MKLTALHLDENKKLIAALRKSLGRSYGINPRQKSNKRNILSHRGQGSIARLHTQTGGRNTDRGEDAGSRSAGYTDRASGIPSKLRHQKFFGVKPPGGPI